MERIESEILYTDLEDGEYFGIFNMVNGEVVESIYMNRKIAIDLAKSILEIYEEE